MGVDPDTFRSVLGQWPSGVTVVTTRSGDTPHGMTASSFTSVSLDPPLVSIAIARHVHSHDLIADAGVFAVNILGKDQVDHGKRFAGMLGLEDRFEGLDTTTAETGCALLPDALGWLDCRVWAAYDGGDHTVFVGEVLAAGSSGDSAPLLYHARSWGQVADVLPDRVTITLTDAGPGHGPLPRRLVTVASVGTGGDHIIVAVDDHDDLEAIRGVTVGGVEIDARAAGARDLVATAHEHGHAVRLAVSCAFGTDGPDLTDVVAETAGRALALTPEELVLDDAPGAADPMLVREVLQRLAPVAGPTPIALRAGRGPMALANVLTALKSGVAHLDVATGDDPYVPADDVLGMLTRMRVHTEAADPAPV